MNPLLSICVPTYNRSNRLRLMLEALLPQVAEHADKVEVWVSDNASPDDTPRVVEEAERLGPLNYSRNPSNLGVIRNIIRLTTELARGEFVWVLGDDDLLLPGALGRVLEKLEAHRGLDVIYLNFCHANYPEHWPEAALGGYTGPTESFANPETADRPLRHWREVVRAENCMCTQLYVNVVRRTIWRDYWRGRPNQEDYSDARWSYPHSYMLAETSMGAPSYYVGEPVLTIFNGGQSWWDIRHSVVLLMFPELLGAFRRRGLPAAQARECEVMVFANCRPLLVEMLEGRAGADAPSLGSYLRANWRFREAWLALGRAGLTAKRPWVFNRLCHATLLLRNTLRFAKNSVMRVFRSAAYRLSGAR